MSHRSFPLPVTTAEQAAARDRAAIGGGVPSFDLMVRAGTATAAIILRDFADHLSDGVAIFAGAGNNGGDAYIAAAQLLRAGVRVRLHAAEPPRTTDAMRAAATVTDRLVHGDPTGDERLAIDGLLGTGHRGVLRGRIATAADRLARYHDARAIIAALDVPSGLDATTGEIAAGSVPAHTTLSYGTMKRGQLIARAHVGRLLLVDIGLEDHAHLDDGAWMLAEASSLHGTLPMASWDTWKTRQGIVGLAGGNEGMAGAIVLAARAALATGAGLVHAVVHDASRAALQSLVPQALAHGYGDKFSAPTTCKAVGAGPGLGRSDAARLMLDTLLHAHALPLVLDADALNLIVSAAKDQSIQAANMLSQHAVNGRAIVCTPHAGEFARMIDRELPSALADRVELAQSFAITSRCTILLKGTPTVVCTSDGAAPVVVARGTPALATGGSGDVLTGIIATLLAQGATASVAAVTGAWLHGRAAEIATAAHGSTRGVGLDRVIDALPRAWREIEQPASFRKHLLADLPPVVHTHG
jgi:NAD(P)H-hydrate epimerase